MMRRTPIRTVVAAVAAGLAVVTTACASGSGLSNATSGTVAAEESADVESPDDMSAEESADETSDVERADDTSADDSTDTDTMTADAGLGAVGSLSSSEVHEISVTFDAAAYEAMLATYTSTGDKEWIEATVTIDGTTYEQVGMRLKGNSSLRGITGDGPSSASASTDDPATLPWLIDLDQFVDGQQHDGLVEFVVRSNNSGTALNEAVALELLQLAGLAGQDAIAVALSVNGSDPELRLVIDNPDDVWMAEALDASGALYKAESTGDYSYRGDDPEVYDEVFDQEAGKDNTDLTPLIEFLQFINESDDATFAAELEQWLDVDAFATYLAMQELLDNFDDIDGPGNNSYLFYDADSGRFTVVPWDYNLAFGQTPGGGGGPAGGAGGAGGAGAPGGMLPAGGRGNGGGGGGPAGRSNVLVERFLAVDEWQALYQAELAELRAALYDSGAADEVLAAWVEVVSSSGLVDAATVQSESDAIASRLS